MNIHIFLCVYKYIPKIYVHTHTHTHTHNHTDSLSLILFQFTHAYSFSIDTHNFTFEYTHTHSYRVATISRLLKIIGLFCRISSLLQGFFAQETCNFKEPTTCSPPYSTLRPFLVLFCHIFPFKTHFHTHTPKYTHTHTHTYTHRKLRNSRETARTLPLSFTAGNTNPLTEELCNSYEPPDFGSFCWSHSRRRFVIGTKMRWKRIVFNLYFLFHWIQINQPC